MEKANSKWVIRSIGAVLALSLVCTCWTAVVLYLSRARILAHSNDSEDGNPSTEPSRTRLPEWTIIVYAAGDHQALEESLWFNVNEMEVIGSNSEMNIVVQIDRSSDAFTGDGDWAETRRYLIQQDNDLDRITSPVVASLGEVDMSNPKTLIDFVVWTIENYPAKKYALVMSGQGGGWTGAFSDMSASAHSDLSLPEIASSLKQIQTNTGIDALELIGFDASHMGQIELFASLHPYAKYMVASEEVVPGYGWSYAAWLGQLAQNPAMDGSRLSQSIVSTYITGDTLLTGASVSSTRIAQEESRTTLSAIESGRVPEVVDAMNQFIFAIAAIDQDLVAEARAYSRSYLSVFGEDVARSFMDLANFSELLAALTDNAEVQQAATQLQAAISSAVIAEKHGLSMSGSHGIAFHFPGSKLYAFTELNADFPPFYAESSDRFLERSVWDEFLAFHYARKEFNPQDGETTVPPRSAEIIAPGASGMSIGPVEISDTQINGDEVVTVSTTVEGKVASIRTAFYFWDPSSQFYWIGDVSYYIAENTITVDGMNMPDYGSNLVQVQYEWSPTLYALTDGERDAFVLLEPIEYLSVDGQTVYAVFGQYTGALGNIPVNARLYFSADGIFLYAYAFPEADENGVSTPVEIRPEIGDQFTDYVQYYSFAGSDSPTYGYMLSDDVFTWGEQGLSFYSSYPVDGQYALGIVAYDFDNNSVANFEFVDYER